MGKNAIPHPRAGHRINDGRAAVIVPSAINTTNFAFWPQDNAGQRQLPSNETMKFSEQWLYNALSHPRESDQEWFGAHELGRGVSGQVGMLVKLDASGIITDRMAVKDVKQMDSWKWTNPSYWRDRLPWDIAIQKRLDDQGGHANVVKYRGHQLSIAQRMYRLFNDACDFGSVASAMAYYSKIWSVYRLYRAYQADQEEEEPVPTEDWDQAFEALGLPRNLGRIPEIGKDRFDPEAMEVIPEAFLWRVFQELVEACMFLRDGNGVDVGAGGDWRPILHRDLHLQNVFLRSGQNKLAAPLPDDRFQRFISEYVEDSEQYHAVNQCVTTKEDTISSLSVQGMQMC